MRVRSIDSAIPCATIVPPGLEAREPALAAELRRRMALWGDKRTIHKIEYHEESDPVTGVRLANEGGLPAHVLAIAPRHFAHDETVIDIESPHLVRVFRGLRLPFDEAFDPDFNWRRWRGDCVASRSDLVAGYSGYLGGKRGAVVEFEVPAFLLRYNRADYVLRRDVLESHGVHSMAGLIRRIGTPDLNGTLRWRRCATHRG